MKKKKTIIQMLVICFCDFSNIFNSFEILLMKNNCNRIHGENPRTRI